MPCLIVSGTLFFWYLFDVAGHPYVGGFVSLTIGITLWCVWWKSLTGTWNIFRGGK